MLRSEYNRVAFTPFVLDVHVSTQVRLVVAADDETHDATALAELWRDVIEEVAERCVRFALVELEGDV